jgi:uncharacterized membrane protein HdeD (DUF308 family)
MMELPSTPQIAQPEGANRVWMWMFALASLLIVLGLVAMSSLLVSALTFVLVVGWLLIIGGVLQLGDALLFRGFGGFAVELFFGLLSIGLGAILLWAPVTTGSVIALLIVGGLIADALLGGLQALRTRHGGWFWPVLIALISLVVGVAIMFNPSLLLLMLGFLVGIHLLMHGVVLLLTALEVRKLSR